MKAIKSVKIQKQMKKFILILTFLGLAKACFWSSHITREDCEDFERQDDGCESVYQGRLQAAEMTSDLYKVTKKYFGFFN